MDGLIEKCVPEDALVTSVINRGYAPGIIEQAIEDRDIDLVVMVAQGDSEVSRFFSGACLCMCFSSRRRMCCW
ncbi:MAG: universal stress protein [Betaproteobacteria bacterium]|nr:universal stress protein [Betaproteobacteria bacterium]